MRGDAQCSEALCGILRTKPLKIRDRRTKHWYEFIYDELQKAENTVRETRGVRKVENHLRIEH